MALTRGSRLLAALAASLALASLATCGLDEQYTGMGEKALPGDPLYPQPDPGQTQPCQTLDVAPGELPPLEEGDLAGKSYRFDTLVLSKPLTTDLADMVNGIVTQQIADQLINVLLVIDKDDRVSGILTTRLGTGDKPADGTTYSFKDAPETIDFTLDGSRISNDKDAALSIAVNMGEDPPLVLPVKALRLAASVKSDASALEGGTLTGAITVSDGEKVVIPLFGNLKAFLDMQDPPIAPDTKVGEEDAWAFEATFTAVASTVK